VQEHGQNTALEQSSRYFTEFGFHSAQVLSATMAVAIIEAGLIRLAAIATNKMLAARRTRSRS
jgi:hypothetical protein